MTSKTKKIVSVQDVSCYGQCSLTVALPILSAYGIETAILPSSILSTHTAGFTGFTVHDLTEEMPKIIDHWKKENITFDAIYTGYIGDARQFSYVKELKELLNEGGELIVDPAMADYGKLYPGLGEDIVEGMRTIVAESSLILPNLTEAALLLGDEYKEDYTRDEINSMLVRLSQMGPVTAVLTGVSFEKGKLGAVSYNRVTKEFTEYFAEHQPKSYHGTGDIFSSVAIAEYLDGKSMAEVLEAACEFVVKAIKETVSDDTHNYGVKFEQVLKK